MLTKLNKLSFMTLTTFSFFSSFALNGENFAMDQHCSSVWLLEAAGVNQFRLWHLGCRGLSAVYHEPSGFSILPGTPEGEHFSPLGTSGG